ncbi:hypothetical protein PAUR_a3021 [Pseudoalteromonas aurantia 208]|uniref:Orphan protein n=1 Tax=Pseudoalteromonas aurantia 208 TaxID=1314867 RepID=A0ABR9EFN0_9GAMM|nr:hypothetical protein [Pseudoalteromonas aurantia 208]
MTKTLLFKIRFRLCIHNNSKITDVVALLLCTDLQKNGL